MAADRIGGSACRRRAGRFSGRRYRRRRRTRRGRPRSGSVRYARPRRRTARGQALRAADGRRLPQCLRRQRPQRACWRRARCCPAMRDGGLRPDRVFRDARFGETRPFRGFTFYQAAKSASGRFRALPRRSKKRATESPSTSSLPATFAISRCPARSARALGAAIRADAPASSEDVADAVRFLIAPERDFITGRGPRSHRGVDSSRRAKRARSMIFGDETKRPSRFCAARFASALRSR